MHKKLVVGLIGIVSATSLIASAQPAAAYSYSARDVYYKNVLRGYGKFQPHGEIITVKDLKADGLGVWVEYEYYKDNRLEDAYCINQTGNGTTKTCNLSIAEGTRVSLRVLSMNGSEPQDFVDWEDYA